MCGPGRWDEQPAPVECDRVSEPVYLAADQAPCGGLRGGLLPGIPYSFAVAAINGIGEVRPRT